MGGFKDHHYGDTPIAEQARQKMRVGGRIGGIIIEFFQSHGKGKQFHAADLIEFVNDFSAAGEYIAPDSPGRIMRDLRRDGRINYRVINRAQSLYEIL